MMMGIHHIRVDWFNILFMNPHLFFLRVLLLLFSPEMLISGGNSGTILSWVVSVSMLLFSKVPLKIFQTLPYLSLDLELFLVYDLMSRDLSTSLIVGKELLFGGARGIVPLQSAWIAFGGRGLSRHSLRSWGLNQRWVDPGMMLNCSMTGQDVYDHVPLVMGRTPAVRRFIPPSWIVSADTEWDRALSLSQRVMGVASAVCLWGWPVLHTVRALPLTAVWVMAMEVWSVLLQLIFF